MGPAVPIPAPREVVDALQSVSVEEDASDNPGGFQLEFKVEKNSPLIPLFLLSGQAPVPIYRVLLIVTMNGQATTLIDGIAGRAEVAPGSNGQPATLRVHGKDLTAAMDFLPADGLPYPAMPPFARVTLILAKYAWLGIIPKVIPSMEEPPIPTDRIARHDGTDLAYVRALAREAGYTFYVQPGPTPGTTWAYWGPDIRVGAPQPALTIDSGHVDNVESLSFSFDKEGTELPVVFIQNQLSKVPIPIPIPSQIPFYPPLGAIPPLPPKITMLKDTAQLSPIQALLRGFAHAAAHSSAVKGDGSLDVLRYGRPLRARALVGVRGAGLAFDGVHFVQSVRHQLSRDGYKQTFSLTRNGLLPTQPRVSV
jgi:hypothetical protein